MNFLFFDTETSGLPNKNLPFEHPEQARIVQFAAVMTDEKFNPIGCMALLSSEDDYIIHPKAEAVHGICKNDCINSGIPSRNILSIFQQMLDKCEVVVGFNSKHFDTKLVEIEAALQGTSIIYPDTHIDVMEVMTDICKLPPRFKGSKYKWPSLAEAHSYCFPDSSILDAHDALGDVNTTIKIFSWLIANNHLKLSDGMVLAI